MRSVDCGAIVKSLMERDLVRIMGRRDAPGRPVLYGTTSNFLEMFGLPAVGDLPSLREIETMAAEQGVSVAEASQHAPDQAAATGEGVEASDRAYDEAAPEPGEEEGGDADESPDWVEEDWSDEEDASA